jgi:hypothetical protein
VSSDRVEVGFRLLRTCSVRTEEWNVDVRLLNRTRRKSSHDCLTIGEAVMKDTGPQHLLVSHALSGPGFKGGSVCSCHLGVRLSDHLESSASQSFSIV